MTTTTLSTTGKNSRTKHIATGKRNEEPVLYTPVSNGIVIPEGIDLATAQEISKRETIEMQDQSLPFIKVAQGMSPVIAEPGGRIQFPGLEVGDFYDTATNRIWKGKEGLIFIPAFYQRTFIKWLPRSSSGAGFVEDLGLARGKQIKPLLTKFNEKDAVPTRLVEGNEVFQIIETAYWAGYVFDEDGDIPPMRAIFAMSSSFLTPSRHWNTAVINYRFPGTQTYIRWARPWRITTETTRNEKGIWSKPVITAYEPEDAPKPFFTFQLPNGKELWSLCESFAATLTKDGLRPTPPDDISDSPLNNNVDDSSDQPF